MIRGYFAPIGIRRRPFINCVFQFPALNRSLVVPLLVDTGADRTVLGSVHLARLRTQLGIDLTTLPLGIPSTGVGGQMETRTIETVVTLDTFTTPLTLTILEAPPSRLLIPSLLGRDILSRFALYVEERANLVLLLDPTEADNLRAYLPL